MAIPKKIHYFWFGHNPKPKLMEKCMKSWKKQCPDYEIIEWNEDNFDVTKNRYCKEAYEAKKWAFVTDYARLAVLYEQGGIYFDTDVEVVKSLDPLLSEQCFMGIENSIYCIKVATGLALGSEAGFPLLNEIMDDYENIGFLKEDGSYDITTCTERNTEILKKHGYVEEDRIQKVAGATIYASEYFSPMEMETGLMYRTKNTYSIHHYSLSWTPKENQLHREKYLRYNRWRNYVYGIKVLPNNILLKLLGEEKYEGMKRKLKG